MIVNVSHLYSFLKRIQSERLGGFDVVILPERTENGNLFYTRMDGEKNIEIDSYRAVDPLKSLFYFPREQILPDKNKLVKRLVLGVKNCDLTALDILDKAMINSDFVDPVYQSWRENTTIVSADCTEISDSCHCNLVDGKPFADKGYDVNLSNIGSDYVIKTGSSKGEEFVELLRKYIPISDDHADDREKVRELRKKTMRRLEAQNSDFVRSGDYFLLKNADIQKWKDESKSCVGCGGCTNICPTCYCLILNDETLSKDFVKVRSYDSCQTNGYARVAGGASPRPKMYERFRNRYLCKLTIMKENFGRLGCTGCGRCIDVCPGKIDFREVISRIMKSPKTQECNHD